VHTAGDRFTEKPLGEDNQIGFFTKEIENELLAGSIDVAVHSLKDLPTVLATGLAMGAMLERDDPWDVLLVRPEALDPAQELPVRVGASIGASSRRRQALMAAERPDLECRPIRGNVTTRIDKALRGDYDAILLSAAGILRLGLDVKPLHGFVLNPRRWPGAPGQSIIAVEVRAADERVMARVTGLDHAPTRLRAEAERSLLVAFGGGCHAPFGSYCEPNEQGFELTVAAPDRAGVLRLERFAAADLGAAQTEAEAWIHAGSGARQVPQDKPWLTRALGS
jgi:hydroxymethylbilane synthase